MARQKAIEFRVYPIFKEINIINRLFRKIIAKIYNKFLKYILLFDTFRQNIIIYFV